MADEPILLTDDPAPHVRRITLNRPKALNALNQATLEELNALADMLAKDPSTNKEEALKEIYKKLRPGDPPTLSNAKALISRMFFDVKRYDLGRVGRYKINIKMGVDKPEEIDSTALTPDDILNPIHRLIKLKKR